MINTLYLAQWKYVLILKDGSAALRLSKQDREMFTRKFRSKLFETYGTVMKEYVTINPDVFKKTKELTPFVKKGFCLSENFKG